MDKQRGGFIRALRAMRRSVQIHYDELKRICDENRYALDFLEDQTQIILDRNQYNSTNLKFPSSELSHYLSRVQSWNSMSTVKYCLQCALSQINSSHQN
jgi:hypothetical protein